jgi:hypothetical protein
VQCVAAISSSVIDASAPLAPAAPIPNIPPVKNPTTGDVLSVDNATLLLNGVRVFPFGGEVHFARVPAAAWRDDLLKMKAGGVSVASVYVFWLHHEEVQGEFNFTGNRDVRAFLEAAQVSEPHDAVAAVRV